MQINTWSSFSKRRNSTKQPTGGTTKTCTLKAPTSLMHPVFLLESFNLSDNYLQWGSRYYYIDDVVILNNGLAEYHCSVDPLASWKSSIGSMNEFVLRAASSYDGAIVDSIYPIKAGVSSFGYDTDQSQSGWLDLNTGVFIVGLVGKGVSGGSGVKYFCLDQGTMQTLLDYMFGGVWLDQTQTDIALATQKQLVNPYQYISSILWLPCDISGIFEYSDNMEFGYWDSGITGDVVTTSKRILKVSGSISASAHPQAASRGSYLNGAPFTTRDFYMWGFGKLVLDPAAFTNGEKLFYDLSIDLWEGSAVLLLSAGTSSETSHEIGKYSSSWLVPVQVGQVTQNVIGTAVTLASSIATGMMGNYMGAAAGIGNAVESIYPRLTTTGHTGTAVGFSPNVPALVSEFRNQTPMDATHNGRPLCQNVTISSLSGYIQTENADVDLPCTQEERDAIAAYMNGGFYYE